MIGLIAVVCSVLRSLYCGLEDDYCALLLTKEGSFFSENVASVCL